MADVFLQLPDLIWLNATSWLGRNKFHQFEFFSSVKKTADISDDMSSQKQALPDAKQLDQMIAAQQKTITNENARKTTFMILPSI